MALVKCADGVWREGGDLSAINQYGDMSIQDLIDEFGYLPDEFVTAADFDDYSPKIARATQGVKRYARWSDI
jgi:hypothetical protein